MSNLDVSIRLAATRYAAAGRSSQTRTTFVVGGHDHAFDEFEITVSSDEQDPNLAIAMAKTDLLDLAVAIHAAAQKLQRGD